MTDDEDPRHEFDRISISLERKHRGVDTPEPNIEILARCDVLWSGWECDYTVVLYRVISTGEVDLHVVAGVSHLGDEGPVALLLERLEAYREAIVKTEAFLERVVQEAPELAGQQQQVVKAKGTPRIITDPEVLGGIPHIEGTRVRAVSVLAEVLAGTFDEEIHRTYRSLPEGSIDAVIKHYADALADELKTRQALSWLNPGGQTDG